MFLPTHVRTCTHGTESSTYCSTMHAQSKAVVPMSRLVGSVAQARTVERAVPQHIVDSFTVGGRSLGRKLSTYKTQRPSYRQALRRHERATTTSLSGWFTVRLPGRPLWCRASQPSTRSWQRRTKGPNSKTPAFFGSARRPRASHSSALTDSVRPPPVDRTGLDE